MTVVVVGSSGGGTATLGHTDPVELLNSIHQELGKIDFESNRHGIRFALFVSMHGGKGMDSANPVQDTATLWTAGFDENERKFHSSGDALQISPYYTGSLKDVNEKCKELEKTILAPCILKKNSGIMGMICISSDPREINFNSIAAAVKMGLPICGSGGTSLSVASSLHYGMNLVGNSGGSVATTTFTRAVSYTHALATSWGQSYSPFWQSKNIVNGVEVVKPHLGSVLDACLPSFLAVMLACRVLTVVESFEFISDDKKWIHLLLSQLQSQALPTVCAVVTSATYAPEHGSSSLMAAALASMGCTGSIISGLVCGRVVSFLLGRLLFICIRLRVPATMTNILVAGCLGAFLAIFFMSSGVTTLFGRATQLIRLIVQSKPTPLGPWNGRGFGFILGCVFCYGSKIGWYHKIFLPIILIEMEHGEASFWGSIDECTLVLVSAGICLANILTSRASKSVSKRGLLINLLCGDFIEVAYPFMEESSIVNISGYIASGVATELLYMSQAKNVLSSAYLPVIISIFLAKDCFSFAFAALSAFVIPFFGMTLQNILYKSELTTSGSKVDNKLN